MFSFIPLSISEEFCFPPPFITKDDYWYTVRKMLDRDGWRRIIWGLANCCAFVLVVARGTSTFHYISLVPNGYVLLSWMAYVRWEWVKWAKSCQQSACLLSVVVERIGLLISIGQRETRADNNIIGKAICVLSPTQLWLSFGRLVGRRSTYTTLCRSLSWATLLTLNSTAEVARSVSKRVLILSPVLLDNTLKCSTSLATILTTTRVDESAACVIAITRVINTNCAQPVN